MKLLDLMVPLVLDYIRQRLERDTSYITKLYRVEVMIPWATIRLQTDPYEINGKS